MRPLRSDGWFAGDDEVALLHRAALRVGGATPGRPVIGLADTTSALNPCNLGSRSLVAAASEAVVEAGGTPAAFPTMSLGEDLMKPSAMLYRNLVAMELEENVRAHPLDGVLFFANCDKSVAAALMAAASIDIPVLLVLGGARGCPDFLGKPLGSGTDIWRALERRRTGALDDAQWAELESCMAAAGTGSCNTMGTASTMGLVAEVLGLLLPGSVGIGAAGAEVVERAQASGRRIVQMVADDVRPRTVLTQAGWDNAVKVVAAVGGSTNAFIHLAAVAGRADLRSDLDRIGDLVADVPLVADVEPAGAHLIEDFGAAGGLRAVVASLGDRLDLDVRAACGTPWRELAVPPSSPVIRPADDPVAPAPAFAVVRGSLAPSGAVIKLCAASPELWQHTGRAVVFTSYDDMRRRLDDPALEIDASDVLVVSGCGPVGVPGMPEWGMAPIPQRLAERGVTDMLRVTDGRMSGTSFGAVVLHCAPEAAVGGPLALVRDGDLIALDALAGTLDLLVDEAELAQRRRHWQPEPSAHTRGWPALYQRHVLQAPDGCDLDFLTGRPPRSTAFVEPVIGRS